MKNIFLFVLITLSLNFNTFAVLKDRTVAQAAATLPDQEKYRSYTSFLETLDLSDSKYQILPSNKSGTSVYIIITENGKAIGALLPENSATVISGEILSFTLARIFNVPDQYQPGFYYFLKGKNLDIFKNTVQTMQPKNKNKIQNLKDVLERIKKNPNGIATVFKPFDIKPSEYAEIVKNESMNLDHKIKGSSRTLRSLLSCKESLPSALVQVSAGKGKTTEFKAAVQISNILLVDALVQQWDRFSGGNLETVTDSAGEVRFVSYDNGGTWGSLNWTKKSLSYVSRFERTAAEKVVELDNYFKNNTPFMGFRTDSEILEAFGIKEYPKALEKLKLSVAEAAQHIKSNSGCYYN